MMMESGEYMTGFVGHETNLRLCLQGIGGCIMGGHPHPNPPPLRVLAHPAREGANWRYIGNG